MREMELREKIDYITTQLEFMLIGKNKVYGESWKKRGGVGAFMMLARKWDRIQEAWDKLEDSSRRAEYDVFKLLDRDNPERQQNLDQFVDLLGYLLLVLTETESFPAVPSHAEKSSLAAEPDGRYVDQG